MVVDVLDVNRGVVGPSHAPGAGRERRVHQDGGRLDVVRQDIVQLLRVLAGPAGVRQHFLQDDGPLRGPPRSTHVPASA